MSWRKKSVLVPVFLAPMMKDSITFLSSQLVSGADVMCITAKSSQRPVNMQGDDSCLA